MDLNETINTNYSECKISQFFRDNIQIRENAPYFFANIISVIIVGTFGNLLTFVAIVNGRIGYR